MSRELSHSLKQAVAQPPGIHAWQRVCRQLTRERAGRKQDLPYVQRLDQALSTWPVSIRVCPPAWSLSLLTGRDCPFPLITRIVSIRWPARSLRPVHARRIAHSPYLRRLHTLELVQAQHAEGLKPGIGPQGACLLATSETLTGLRQLMLPNNRITDAGLAALAASPVCHNLDSLDLSLCAITQQGAAHLAAPTCTMQLKTLRLANNRLGDRGCETLSRAICLKDLRHLDLSGSHIGRKGAAKLAQAPYLRNLRSLNLAHNQVTDTGAELLLTSIHLPALRSLNLLNNRLTALTARLLTKGGLLPGLKEIVVGKSEMGKGADLLGSPASARLGRKIQLQRTPAEGLADTET